jgi:hypothetical protein
MGPTWIEGRSRCQFFGAAFARPQLARVLAEFTRTCSRDVWRANFLVAVQITAKSHGLANYLVGSVLADIQTHPKRWQSARRAVTYWAPVSI